jgi:hypothetical protein
MSVVAIYTLRRRLIHTQVPAFYRAGLYKTRGTPEMVIEKLEARQAERL